MTIQGVGTDLVAKQRIAKIYARYPARFIARILSKEEQELLPKEGIIDFLAKRFAGKEAVAKALGTGIGQQVAFKEISITNLPTGKPQVKLLGKAKKLIETRHIKNIHISLADEKDLALAFVILG
jgi:holo-[acyl-carrier protein] synthase